MILHTREQLLSSLASTQRSPVKFCLTEGTNTKGTFLTTNVVVNLISLCSPTGDPRSGSFRKFRFFCLFFFLFNFHSRKTTKKKLDQFGQFAVINQLHSTFDERNLETFSCAHKRKIKRRVSKSKVLELQEMHVNRNGFVYLQNKKKRQ